MMFTDVTIEKRATIYFDGKVTSRTVLFPDGTKKTLGIMLPGTYTFTTVLPEEMAITAGTLRYQIEGDSWQTITDSGVFYVPANSSFHLDVETVTDYCCSYLVEAE